MYAATSFAASVTSWCWLNDIQNATSVILYMYINIIFIAKWLYGADFQILHCSGAFGRRQKTFKPENTFKQTHVNFFTAKIWHHFSITSQLRLGPFLRGAAQLASCVLTLVQCICYFEYYPRRTSVNFVLKIKRSRSLGYFNAPDLKGPRGASSNRIVHLCVCLSVRHCCRRGHPCFTNTCLVPTSRQL